MPTDTASGFDAAFEALIGFEGGFQDGYHDRGNWTSGVVGVGKLKGTKYGISAMSYPELDIEGLTLPKAKAIYHRDYWLPLGGAALPRRLRFPLFDTAVNSGVKRAIRLLQRAVRVREDGDLGPVTIAKVNSLEPYQVVAAFCGHRIDFMNDQKVWSRYSVGWSQRVAELLIGLGP